MRRPPRFGYRRFGDGALPRSAVPLARGGENFLAGDVRGQGLGEAGFVHTVMGFSFYGLLGCGRVCGLSGDFPRSFRVPLALACSGVTPFCVACD